MIYSRRDHEVGKSGVSYIHCGSQNSLMKSWLFQLGTLMLPRFDIVIGEGGYGIS